MGGNQQHVLGLPKGVHSHDFTNFPGRGNCISHVTDEEVEAERDGKICPAHRVFSFSLLTSLPLPCIWNIVLSLPGLFSRSRAPGSAVPGPQQGQAAWPRPTGLSPYKAH